MLAGLGECWFRGAGLGRFHSIIYICTYIHTYVYTVEPVNKGRFGTTLLFFTRRLSSLEGPKCIRAIGRMYYGTSRCVLCREVIILHLNLGESEVPL